MHHPGPSTAATRAATTCAAIAGLAALALAAVRPASAQELRYSLTPTAQWVQWDEALGIDDAHLVGGRAGFSFGQYLELQGYYLTRSRIDRELGDFGTNLPSTSPTSLGIRNYGADIVLNLASTRLKPFVRAGGSILRFEPDGADDTRQIALRYGGGLRFGNPGQLRLQLYVEDLVFRLDRGRLDGQPAGADPEAGDLRHNLVYGAGISVPLGGATTGDDAPRFSLSSLSLPVEVFGGVLNFADDIGFDGQNVVGARTGVNFGPLVSLRGYYWRGVGDDFTTTEGIQSWGGEGQFRLNAGAGLNPYLIAGAGQLDFRGDYDASSNPIAPADRAMLILGGGVALELTDRLRLNVAARNHLFNAEGEIEDVARADDLTSNWLLSAGLGFNIGGSTDDRPGAPRVPVVARVDTVYVEQGTGAVVRQARGEERVDRRDDERRRMRASVGADSVLVRRMETVRVVDGDTVRAVVVDTLRGERARLAPVEAPAMGERRVEIRGGADQPARGGYAGERMVTIPVPTEGELYVRYGPADSSVRRPGTVRGDAVRAADDEAARTRQVIREILREELDRRGGSRDTSRLADRDAQELFERRLLDRVDSAVIARARLAPAVAPSAAAGRRDGDMRELERQRLLQDIERIVRDQVRDEMNRRRELVPAPGPVVVPYAPPPTDRIVVGVDGVARAAQPSASVRARSFAAYTGLNVNENAQFVVGARLDVGPVTRRTPNLRFVPEFAIGIGEGTTTLLNASAQYRPSAFDIRDFGFVQLYGALGLGAYVGTFEGDRQLDLTLNPAYGVEFTIADLRAATGTSQLFAEHQGIDLFQRNRFVVGLRWPY